MNAEVLVLGIGNELRGDDALGLLVARDIAEMRLPGVKVLQSQDDGARLMVQWHGYSSLIIVDAVRSGAPEGTLHRVDISRAPIPAPLICASSHQFGVAAAVETSRALAELPEKAMFFGIDVRHCVAGAPSHLYKKVRSSILSAVLEQLSSLVPAMPAFEQIISVENRSKT